MSREHIIPQGLNGTRYLDAASCEPCRLITHRFESIVQRGMIWPARRMVGVGGRRKQKETIATLATDYTGQRLRVEFKPEDIPVKAILPVFPGPPEVLRGYWPEAEDVTFEMVFDQGAVDRATAAGMPGTSVDVDVLSFVRMIAKIAHCEAVGVPGLDAFEPHLPGLILGEHQDWRALVGASQDERPGADEWVAQIQIHRLHDAHEGWLLGRVRLFGVFNGPVYDVAIGRLRGDPSDAPATG